MSRPRICTPGIATLLLIATFGQLAIVARALTLPNQPPVGILVAIGLALAAGLQLRAESAGAR